MDVNWFGLDTRTGSTNDATSTPTTTDWSCFCTWRKKLFSGQPFGMAIKQNVIIGRSSRKAKNERTATNPNRLIFLKSDHSLDTRSRWTRKFFLMLYSPWNQFYTASNKNISEIHAYPLNSVSFDLYPAYLIKPSSHFFSFIQFRWT